MDLMNKQTNKRTHTEIREMAIRREMERIIYDRKLKECADDWATPVASLSDIVKKPAAKWAKAEVSDAVVQQVLTAWEMERHHSAERHLFPSVIDSLKKIKEEHPDVIIGAVTDGKANPLLMTFTLAPYFDFCMSWEDEQGGRQQFFRDLNDVETTPELTWIYDAARHKYAVLKEAQCAISAAKIEDGKANIEPLVWPDNYDDLVWIHVGDDLAFDVGGSVACGAKTILVELPKSLGQTAPYRFDTTIQQPDWSTTSPIELEARISMNKAARDLVSVEINTLERLPIAINQILQDDL
jgi:FMN phosphatase YigB (HAD superfamily)